MKHLFKSILTVIVMLSLTATTFAQTSASATATATILTPIAITKDIDMNFGNLAVNNTAGTVILAPDGTRTATAGVTFLPTNPGTVTAAAFTVTGLADATYSITLPSGATTLTSAGNTMTVDTWTSSPTPTGTLTGGSEEVYVGGTLNVGASQPAGIYISGTPFTVTVNYN